MDMEHLTKEEIQKLYQIRNSLIRAVVLGEGPHADENMPKLDTICRVLMTYKDYGCNK